MLNELYKIEEEGTNGWSVLASNLPKDDAKFKLQSLIDEGYNPNYLRVRKISELLNG
tara:strand:- start:227 stop:397 length:171 start_codon:yes stop_codon:yes gene_type:complete